MTEIRYFKYLTARSQPSQRVSNQISLNIAIHGMHFVSMFKDLHGHKGIHGVRARDFASTRDP